MSAYESASFWRENAIAIVILLRVLVRMACSGGNKFINVRSFIIFRSTEALNSFKKNNLANFSDGKNVSGVSTKKIKIKSRPCYLLGRPRTGERFLRVHLKLA